MKNTADLPIDVASLSLLIVDDEKEACDNLSHILEEYIGPGITISGIANDTEEAEKLLAKIKPHAVFLDIEMPGENGFQFLERISPYDFEVVFVTAYDEFAIKAFKLNAVDYILKPIIIDELIYSVKKLKEKIVYKQFTDRNKHEAEVLKEIIHRKAPHRITLRSQNHVEIVNFKDIYYLEGQGSYCKVSFNKDGINKEIITSSVIAYYEELLPTELFFRVHKSFLLNCMHVSSIISDEHYHAVIKTKEKIPVSRRRYSEFIGFLKENNFHLG
jgi:two-component system, LytTR family, response regulator